jgi:hypothetical protein
MSQQWQRPLWFDLTIGPVMGIASCLLVWAILGADAGTFIYLIAFLGPAVGCTVAFLYERNRTGPREQIQNTPRNKAILGTWIGLNFILPIALFLVPFNSDWQKVIAIALSLNQLWPKLLLSKELS